MNTTAEHQDEAFRRFLAGLLGDLQLFDVWVNAKVYADYQARGVFPEVTSCRLVGSGPSAYARTSVSESVVRAMLLDACAQIAQERANGNKRPTKWSWLRNRLRDELS